MVWLRDGQLVPISQNALAALETHVAEKKLVQRDGKWTVKYVPPTVGAQVMRAMLTGRDIYSQERNCNLADRLPKA